MKIRERIQRLIGEDTGSVTIEAALSLSSLVMVGAAFIAGLATVGAHISAVDSAGAAARAYAIGEDYQPPRGEITVKHSGGLVTVTAEVGAPFGKQSASAVFPEEIIAQGRGESAYGS